MQPPILVTGALAWKAGHTAIRSGAFHFCQTADDLAYQDLQRYAATQAEHYLAEQAHRFTIAPEHRTRLFAVYVRAFCNGAFDEAMEHDETAGPSET